MRRLSALLLAITLLSCTKPQFLAVVTAADAICQPVSLLDTSGVAHEICMALDAVTGLLEQALAAQRSGTDLVVVVRKGDQEERIAVHPQHVAKLVERLTAAKASALKAGACK
jgi:D-serine deaminase-like pyridoxal phosphate-dependent protein